MGVLKEAIQLITQPPGSLVYYLVTLFALQQALFSALGGRRSAPDSSLTRRWVWAVVGMLAARVALIVVGLLSLSGSITPLYVLPPLERWIIYGSVLTLAWSAVFGFRPRPQQTLLLLALLAVGLAVYGYVLLARTGASATGAPRPDTRLWEQVLVLAALAVAALSALVYRAPQWEWVVGISLTWMLGTFAQLAWGQANTAIDGWQRLASLIALPLLSVLAHRQLLTSPSAPGEVGAIQAAPLLDIIASVETARELEPALIVASSKLADLLQVRICAIALNDRRPAEVQTHAGAGDDVDTKVRVIAIHPPTAASTVPPQIRLAAYEGLSVAYHQQQITVAPSPHEDPWLLPLYEALGLEKPAPLATFPLQHDREVIGLLLLGDPIGRRWRHEDLDEILVVARALADAIIEHETRRQTPRVPSIPASPPSSEEQRQLSEVVEQAKAQIRGLNTRIKTLIQEIKARDEEILALNSELEARGRGSTEKELEVWQTEVRQLADERETLQRKVKELTQDRDVLLNDRARLSDELVSTRQRLAEVEAHRESLETELARLQAQPHAAVTDTIPQVPAPPRASAEGPAHVPSGSSMGLAIANEDGEIVMTDAVAREVLHLAEDSAVGQSIYGAYPDPRWTRAVDSLLDPTGTETPERIHLSLPIRGRDGTLEADLVALRGRDERLSGMVVTLRMPAAVDDERQEAIMSVANDFRTPMTAMTGYTDLLLGEQAGILTDMQQQFLERIKANVEQLDRLLDDLIRVVSPTAQGRELSPQAVSLADVVEEAIMGLSARFRERKLAVQLDFPPRLPSVEADRDSLYQVMLRLLSNAVLCSKEQTQILISAREQTTPREGPHIRVSVTDTGGGIAPEDYPRVFRHVYRARHALVQGMGETGVGMAMAKTLVEAQGGHIWVESHPGKGSTFSFLLPLAPVGATPAGGAVPQNETGPR